MTDELDDALDLSAWEAPAPPGDLADAVLARMGGTVVAPSMPAQPQRSRSRATLIAGVAAACLLAAIGSYALIRRGTQYAGPAMGDIVAQRAQTVSLGSTRVELDPGARLAWKRVGNELRVEQPAGVAAWRVGGEDRLSIDAGATTASVEASGASLRVEVKMNQADAKVIGGAAATAAVVSLVSVVVYEGYVKVAGSPGQPTVIVQPGSTYTVTPPPKQVEPPVVGAQVPTDEPKFDPDQFSIADVLLPGGETATIHAAKLPVLVEIDMQPSCYLAVDGVNQPVPTIDLDAGEHETRVECPGKDPMVAFIGVERDDFTRPLAQRGSQVTRIKADGREYRVDFQDEIPAIEVSGGTGVLHVREYGGNERSFSTNRIEPGQLAPGGYALWFEEGGEESDLYIGVDTTTPVLSLADVRWSADQTQITGTALPHSTLSVRSLQVPLLTDGRFMLGVAVADVTTLRVDHTYRGTHYFVLRAPKRVAGTTGSQLDRSAIMKVMTSGRARIQACSSKASGATQQGKIVVDVTVAAGGSVSAASAKSTFDRGVSDCVIAVIKTLVFPKAQASSTFSFPLAISGPTTGTAGCDVDKLRDKITDLMNLGQFAAALALSERALACKPGDAALLRLAFANACNAQHSVKAKQYYAKLGSADQKKFAQICIRNNVAYQGAACDTRALNDEGIAAINRGEHAKALETFEESLDCKRDAYIIQLAFMEACNSGNEAKSKEYWTQLTPAQRTKYKTVCERNHVELDDEAAIDPTGKGFLRVNSKPDAQILIDGVDTGLTTPITGQSLPLLPGKHKVTFVIGDDRFTYPVIIKAGATETMTKDLQ